jgi:hypothetical protein
MDNDVRMLALAALALCAALAIGAIVHGLRQPAARGAKVDLAWLVLRWFAAALLSASAAWVAVAPRADQPVLDLVERVFPAVRAAYMEDIRGDVAAAREGRRWWISAAFALFAVALVVSKVVPPLPDTRGSRAPPGGLTR